MIAYFEPVTQTSPSRSRRQDREEITQAAKGVAQPSKACQGYQEGHRRYRRKEEIILLAIPISAYTFYAMGSRRNIDLLFSDRKDLKTFPPWVSIFVTTRVTTRRDHTEMLQSPTISISVSWSRLTASWPDVLMLNSTRYGFIRRRYEQFDYNLYLGCLEETFHVSHQPSTTFIGSSRPQDGYWWP